MRADLPPEALSFITRVCGYELHNLRLGFGQARSRQIAHALDALLRGFDLPMMNAV